MTGSAKTQRAGGQTQPEKFAAGRKISSGSTGALSWAHTTGVATVTALWPPRCGHRDTLVGSGPCTAGVKQAQNKANTFPRHHLIVFVSAGCIHHLPAATRSTACTSPCPGSGDCSKSFPAKDTLLCLLLPLRAGCSALLQPTAAWQSPNLCSLNYSKATRWLSGCPHCPLCSQASLGFCAFFQQPPKENKPI